MKKLLFFCSFVVLVVLISNTASANIIYTNYQSAQSSYNGIGYGHETIEPFTTKDLWCNWLLDDVKLSAYTQNDPGNGTNATISIYNDDNGSAGLAIASWDVGIDTSLGESFLIDASGVSLAPDRDYWFGVESTDWNNFIYWQATYGSNHVFEITGEPVPEPASIMLLGSLATGLLGVASLKRKK
jgi:hypothetical protein